MKTLVRTSVFLLAALLLPHCHRTGSEGQAEVAGPAVKAKVEVLKKEAVETSYEAVGTVRPVSSATIQSRIVGHVVAVNVKEGDSVEPGQALINIDDREARAQLQKAESGLNEAQQSREEVERATQATAQGKAAADAGKSLAQTTFERYRNLSQQQAVSRQAYDEAEAKQKAATAESARAGEMYQSLRAKRNEVDARIAQAEAELKNARVMLSYTQLTAPMAGRVTMKNVDVGDMAAPGVSLLEIEARDHWRLEVTVDEAHVGRIEPGNKAAVVIDALGAPPLDGVVAEIVPAADPASRSFLVKVELPPAETLRSGIFGRAQFAGIERPTMTIPATAVTERGQITGVFAVDERGVAHLRIIRTGKRFGERIEVLSGLNEGDRVVIENVERVSDGARVEP
ncbi:MAG: efflux RND transporter periplasmic adaptor subunit [Candidatus Hydrogenedentes bacterium]|nr:efflux RND transporter periplasmic adaptor subunit [Candidatus Hydrogenedentota bacterium]